MPYKYVVSVDSKGFSEASDQMLRALGRLTWATEKAVTNSGDEFLPPNELLTLGYFDEMKIGVWLGSGIPSKLLTLTVSRRWGVFTWPDDCYTLAWRKGHDDDSHEV